MSENEGGTATATPEIASTSGQTAPVETGHVFDKPGFNELEGIFGKDEQVPEETETGTETEGGETPDVKTDEVTDPLTGKPMEQSEPVITTETQPLLAGRFKSAQELETAYNESSKEARRLYGDTLALTKQLNDLQNELESKRIESELGAFKELSEEELTSMLESEDPKERLKAHRYMIDENNFKSSKSRLAKEQQDRKVQKEVATKELHDTIAHNTNYVFTNEQNYPGANTPVMRDMMVNLLDKTSDKIAGHPWTPELLYYASRGILSLKTDAKAREEIKKSTELAKATAVANAKAAGSSGSPATSKSPTSSDDLDDPSFVSRMVGTRSKKLFDV